MSDQPKNEQPPSERIVRIDGANSNANTNTNSSEAMRPYLPLEAHPGTRGHLPKDFVPRPHRCNPHLNDVIDSLFETPMRPFSALSVFVRCLASKPGEEPERLPKSDS